MNTTLVVMAAGIGSRYGGLKQVESLTPDGKCLLDFSVYDAVKAGFNKIVFVIRDDIKDDFVRLVGNRIAEKVPVEYVLQDMSTLPRGRTKPFGTGHAILCCKDVVREPFATINADDYYGANAFYDIYNHLTSARKGEYAMTAYKLGNTLSAYGTVSRGICEIREGYLRTVTERKKINCDMIDEQYGEKYCKDTVVSMSLWGLTCDIFEHLQREFDRFTKTADLTKDEFLLNDVIFTAINSNAASVKVYENADKWYGITYREDLPELKGAIQSLIANGQYKGI